MPQQFLRELDRTAHKERTSRSALIREAVELYIQDRRSMITQPGFVELSEALRQSFMGQPEEEIQQRIDQAVAGARELRGGE